MLRIATLLLLCSLPALGNELFIGTVTRHGTQLVLTRCDAAKTRYLLVDAADNRQPVIPTLLGAGLDPQRPTYLALFARYDARHGRDYLVVSAVKHLEQGRSCHLPD